MLQQSNQLRSLQPADVPKTTPTRRCTCQIRGFIPENLARPLAAKLSTSALRQHEQKHPAAQLLCDLHDVPSQCGMFEAARLDSHRASSKNQHGLRNV